MDNMFNGCSLLNSLDLSNFNLSNNNLFFGMFLGCSNLNYINLNNSILKNNHLTMFNELLVTIEKIMICTSKDIILDANDIKINCRNNYSEDKEQICYTKTINIEYNKYICDICGINYYQIYNNDSYINNLYNNYSDINCYITPDGYYLDKMAEYPQPKKCYPTCKICDMEGNETNHNCIECNSNLKTELNIYNYFNCFDTCKYYYYIDINSNKTYCTKNLTCPLNYNKLIINKSECIDNCNRDPTYNYEINNICYNHIIGGIIYNSSIINEYNELEYIINNSYKISDAIFDESYKSSSENINTYNNNISNILEFCNFSCIIEYILNNYNKTNILLGNDSKLEIDNKLIVLSSTQIQRLNMNKNETTIDLLECEEKIKNIYNISLNNSLFILKIDIKEEGMKIPKIIYEVYYPLYSEKLIKLNLAECENKKIHISIPVNIEDNIDKYNRSSNYYNNICSKTTSNFGTDLSLSDRKKLFIDKNMTLCEEDCDLIDYDYSNKKAKCSCLIKINFPLIENIKFDKNRLYKSFTDINTFANIKFMKCYKNVFKEKSLNNNYGLYINIIIIFIFFISLFLFYYKYYFYLLEDIKKIIEAKLKIFSLKKMYKIKLPLNNNSHNILRKKKKRNNKNL